MSIIMSIIYFALVLSILVFVHELGHLIAAKMFGVYCQEFAIGMGPKVFSIKKPHWETTYSIRALPLGGFVSMAGEPGEGDMGVPVERSMVGIARWKRLIIMLAGIFMNLVLAVVVYAGMFSMNGVVEVPKPIVAAVVEGMPADKAGMQANDVMTEITFADGSVVHPKTFADLQTGMAMYKDKPMTIKLDRNGASETVTVTPEPSKENKDVYVIGIQAPAATLRNVNLFEAVPLAFAEVGSVIAQMIFILNRVFRGIGLDSLGGPIAIFGATSQVNTYGAVYFFNLVALLSVNLAVVNLLPIPIMDGGRVVITLIEMIIRRPIPEKLENALMIAGVALVLVFFVYISFQDVMRIIPN